MGEQNYHFPTIESERFEKFFADKGIQKALRGVFGPGEFEVYTSGVDSQHHICRLLEKTEPTWGHVELSEGITGVKYIYDGYQDNAFNFSRVKKGFLKLICLFLQNQVFVQVDNVAFNEDTGIIYHQAEGCFRRSNDSEGYAARYLDNPTEEEIKTVPGAEEALKEGKVDLQKLKEALKKTHYKITRKVEGDNLADLVKTEGIPFLHYITVLSDMPYPELADRFRETFNDLIELNKHLEATSLDRLIKKAKEETE